MSDSISKLSIKHDDVLKRVQIFENAALECFENKKNLSEKDYLKIVTPCRTLFKTGLASHFKFEEVALFPIIITKSSTSAKIVNTLISEHSMIMSKFYEFEKIEEYNLSIKLLKSLMNDLSFHAKAEEDFFSIIHLTKDEIIKIDEIAKDLGYIIP
ncbi:hemerythrin domain-containing protein [Thermoproteota archaeon]